MDRLTHVGPAKLWHDVITLTSASRTSNVSVAWTACCAKGDKDKSELLSDVVVSHLCDRTQGRHVRATHVSIAKLRWRALGRATPQPASVTDQYHIVLNAKLGLETRDELKALHWACRFGFVSVCQFIQEWGTSPTVLLRLFQDEQHHFTPEKYPRLGPDIRSANERDRHRDFVSTKEVSDIVLVRADCNRPLIVAAENGHLDVCRFLKSWGLTVQDLRNSGAIVAAAKGGHLHVLKFLKAWRDEVSIQAQQDEKDGTEEEGLTPCDVATHNYMAFQVLSDNEVYHFLKEWILQLDRPIYRRSRAQLQALPRFQWCDEDGRNWKSGPVGAALEQAKKRLREAGVYKNFW